MRVLFAGLGLVALILTACTPAPVEGVPEEVVAINVLGTAYLGQLKWAEAEKEFRRALELRPGDPLLLTNAAIAVNQQGRIDEAVELLEAALAADTGFPQAQYNLGLIASREGEYELAAGHFEAVAAIDGDDLFTQYYLGTSLARIEREDEAVTAFRKALQRDPTHVSTLYGLGRLLLQRGEQDEGLKLVERSQEIRERSGLDTAVGSEYGEQGPFGLGIDYPGNVLPAPPPVVVAFSATTGVSLEAPASGLAWTLTPSADASLLLVAQKRSVLQIVPPGRSEPVAPPAPEPGDIVALAAGDVDDDGAPDLVALQLAENTLLPALWKSDPVGGFGAPTRDVFSGKAAADVGGPLSSVDMTFVDRDHDGDMDLFWCWASRDGRTCRIGTNDGAGSFEVSAGSDHGFAAAAGDPGPVQVAFSDVDNDRDVDLVVGGHGAVTILGNQRDGTFSEIPVDGALERIAIHDLNKDGWMDLVGASSDGIVLRPNRRGRFDPAEPLGEAGNYSSLLVFDADNDGFLDLAAGSASAPVLFRNTGGGRFVRTGWLDGLPAGARPMAALDADGDGDLDLVLNETAGGVMLAENRGGNANRWMRLRSTGVGDNHFGVGAKVEVLAGALRQKFEVTDSLPLHVGLGTRERAQSIRYLWPSGVLQDEIELAAGEVVEITQLDRKGTSCPLLYAWQDGRWQFVTDFLGGSAVGYQVAPGVFSSPDTDEYVPIRGGLTPDAEGRVRVRVNNQLEEVIWFDRLQLVAVDHPTGTEVHPDERLMPGPPFPEFRLFASSDVRPIAAAHDPETGTDLTLRLRDLDRQYAGGFELLRPKGYAASHVLELDLGRLDRRQRLVLLLDGWIDYADSSANVAAAQAGLALQPPAWSVADGQGGWLRRPRVGGFPAGLPKTMTADLTGLFPSDDLRVRIETNMRIYWDRVRVLVGGDATPVSVTRVEAVTAELRDGGFPREVSPDGRKPRLYDPASVEPRRAWKAHVGTYTAHGDVAERLAAIDDRFVTTRNGDEIELRFQAPPGPPSGFRRTWLLFADGFGKDMDPNSAASERVGPMPFHGMPHYPYGPEVRPPFAADQMDPDGRRVLPSDDGWPGAPMWPPPSVSR